MIKIDKGSLLSPFPIIYKGLTIYKPTLKEIYEQLGIANYNRSTNLLTITDIDLGNYYKNNNLPLGEVEPYLWLLQNAQNNKTFLLELSLAFFTYVKRPLIIKNNSFCLLDEKNAPFILTREDFPDFQKIIRLINCVEEDNNDEDEIITDNLYMKQKFMEKRRKLKEAKEKERKKEAEKNKGQEIQLPDMISALCVFNCGYTLTNVWDLTIYQLHNQFKKCQEKDIFEKDYAALLAGADKKKVKLKNWIKN